MYLKHFSNHKSVSTKLNLPTLISILIIFSVDLAVSALAGSLYAMVERVTAEKTIILMKSVQEINNVQVPPTRVDLAMV